MNSVATPWLHRDTSVMLIGLLLLLAWDASGWDLAVMKAIADGHSFPWRSHWLTGLVLHQGGRWLSWGVVAALVLEAVFYIKPGPSRQKRFAYIAGMVLCALLVPLIKRISLTSCPWDLTEFGGKAHYVSHWAWGMVDGGAGHCFPSGHAVAAFGFFGMYFLWRDHDDKFARGWLMGVLIVGLLFALTQTLRGAHYPSHSAWTAWLSWTVFSALSVLFEVRTALIRQNKAIE
jgi:membrane-associated PAP2 superfamily phosphatase